MKKSFRILAAVILSLATVAVSTSYAAGLYDENPTPKRAPLPDYPDNLRAEKIEGTVVIRVFIDESGSVTNAEVVKSTDKRFEEAAVDTVKKKWKFTPAKKDGAGVACKVNVPIRFALND